MRRIVLYIAALLLVLAGLFAGIFINRFYFKPIDSDTLFVAHVEKNDFLYKKFLEDLTAHLADLGYRPTSCPRWQIMYYETSIKGTFGQSYFFVNAAETGPSTYLRINQFGTPLYAYQVCLVSIADKEMDHSSPLWNSQRLITDLNAWAQKKGATLGDF